MIRMVQSRAAGHAKAYFANALSKADYYVADQELVGAWQGRLAERLGIGGDMTKEAFYAMCDNLHPLTGKRLTPRTKDDRTIGYDINFHCPKSVSILHVFAKDDHILKAFQHSVTETMRDIETDSMTAVRKGKAVSNRQTGELAWAHFVHQTARPVEGFAPDPHLHSHCFVFNATWDNEEKRYKAGQFRDIKKDMPYYQSLFQKRLADKLFSLGYGIRRTEKSFEVENVPQNVISLFSKRTDEIGRIAKEKGITDAKELGELGARTRAKKQKGASMGELQELWREQIETIGNGGSDAGEKTVRFAAKETPSLTAQQCVDYALSHCFERASVMPERRLLETACRFGLGNGSVSVREIAQAFKADKGIIRINEKGQSVCTTKEVLQEERRMVELAKEGRGKFPPLYRQAPPLALNGQQAAAVTHILTTSDMVSIVKGGAGTGKTTLMREAHEKIKAAGKQMIVVAPTAQASRGVLKNEGFVEAETVAKLLIDKKMQENLKGQVLWVDEAGLLGTKDMTALLEIATKQNARLVLGGDTRQHASVIRGDALRILNTIAGIQAAEVSKIYRQQNEQYRAAVEDLSKGDVKNGFDKLAEMGAIKTIDPMNAPKELAADYVDYVAKGKSALVISPTHEQGEAVTDEIRLRLREKGLIGKKEITVARLTNTNMTEAQKSDGRNYEPGQVIQFSQNVPGIKRGSVWMVAQADGKTVQLQNATGEAKILPLQNSKAYEVYRQADIHLSKGDKVRITRNGFDEDKKRLNNGQMLEVVSVSKKGNITLRSLQNEEGQNLYTLNRNFGHIAHAHCITSHASQGNQAKKVFIYQPSATFAATDAKQFYVSVSRGREGAAIYTDDRQALLAHAAELGERRSALELVTHKKQKNFVMQRERMEHEKGNPAQKQKNKDYERDI
ncbi:MAG: relaxase domain-containing protein [Bacteroidetes bacterium]|nr:relaxase domain-containing protein [Bacteroidota bacterium]